MYFSNKGRRSFESGLEPLKRGSFLWLIRNIGLLMATSGGIFALGNRTGVFPTFPFAGAIFLALGLGVYVGSLAAQDKR